ncbi:MAG: helix-turn-helix transcriptional regulator [Sphingomonadales bacterium]|nr:helix-turn-helix transcriptional regulator [Sphingomonadales bacterium]MBK6719598.1 helix-turn-helix transcriptional regulator [Sphingomonadales bacterium]MBK8860349.1 helix-turn-helix transcriptional regulator [Sphingomonadales bacterium]MBK9589427.1 helix-turn-helix transcriptional regulator [Sphingomonadales bacterium]MBK9999769.1 helix-turn-helix transcriptional regulator [Sphingomonadales bacterium]
MPRVPRDRTQDHLLVPLGLAIRDARTERKISQEGLAHAARIERSHMGKLERGERNVSFLNLMKIAEALDCRLSELLSRANY